MRFKKWFTILSIVLLSSLSLTAQEHVKFKIKNAGVTVDGTFEDFKMDVSYDPANLASARFNGKIDVSSINTGIDMRDEHLVGEEYFNVADYPSITFKSTSVTKLTDGNLKVKGVLKIKSTSENIELTVKPTKSGEQWLFTTTITLDRLDYGVGESSWILSDDVKCMIKAAAN